MKKIIITLIVLLLGAGLGFGAYTMVQDHRYQQEISEAKKEVKAADWDQAEKHYKKAQSIKMTPTTQTALTQLDHAKKAGQAAKDENYHLAQSQYQTALNVDDGLQVINSAVSSRLQVVDKDSRTHVETQARMESERKARSSAIQASKDASYSREDSREISKQKAKSASMSKAKAKKQAHTHTDANKHHSKTSEKSAS
ncbi:thiol:disulfide interchange protein [Weissella uvarum]|uniref:hypothetical protein n=1 Tax=Weissella uvarum TaxID=1479233 RepID=UPI00195F49A6|nr:hypothetical protein [Weissella uvarum]MBM7616512.1 thiol:disulfide interchange protein [Weissella uvarum]MCM0595027.1 hypothetical protein [Weissella uvarum]